MRRIIAKKITIKLVITVKYDLQEILNMTIQVKRYSCAGWQIQLHFCAFISVDMNYINHIEICNRSLNPKNVILIVLYMNT